MLRVTIIGLGFVGLTLTSFLSSKKIKVIGIDSNQKKIDKLGKGCTDFFEPDLEKFLKKGEKFQEFTTNINSRTLNSDFIFITVGTPLDKKNKINLESVKLVTKKISRNLNKNSKKTNIILKSTVIPDTAIKIIKQILEKDGNVEGKDYEIISNPEFLREGSAMHDTIKPHVIVIGGRNQESRKNILKFYKSIYPKNQQYFETNNTTAEMIKYANNAFLATKISFINALANICQNIPDTNVDDIAKVMGMDPRISSSFLKAGPGYGGSCFPKDVQALISYSKSVGYNPKLLEAVQENNQKQVLSISKILEKELGNLKSKKIGIFGLSFKENTDDIRESVSIRLIKHLLKQKCIIFAHDPKAIDNTIEIFADKITYCKKFDDVFRLSDCAVLMTPWENYKKITSKQIKKLKKKLFIDTRRILKIDDKEIIFISLGVGENESYDNFLNSSKKL